MKQRLKIPLNVFSLLVVAALMSFAFRTVHIISTAAAVEETVKPTTEEPPPLTKEDIKKAVSDTAKEVNGEDVKNAAAAANTPPGETSKAAEGPASIDTPAAPSLPVDTTTPDDRVFTAAEIEVLQSLAKRRDELDKREKTISGREALLSAAEQEVERKVQELDKLKKELEALLGKQQNMEEERIVSLVKIYEGMKPKEAATIFNTLDMDILLTVIGRMNERRSSPILAAMDPEKARAVTIKLAEQRKLPEKDAEKKAPPAETPLNLPATQPAAPPQDPPF